MSFDFPLMFTRINIIHIYNIQGAIRTIDRHPNSCICSLRLNFDGIFPCFLTQQIWILHPQNGYFCSTNSTWVECSVEYSTKKSMVIVNEYAMNTQLFNWKMTFGWLYTRMCYSQELLECRLVKEIL